MKSQTLENLKLIENTLKVESTLPVEGVLVIRETEGAACDSPIFRRLREKEITHRKTEEIYGFDSYGMIPANFTDWNAKGYGMCGSFGYCSDIKTVAESIRNVNGKGRVGLADSAIIEDLKKAGFIVRKTKWGFR